MPADIYRKRKIVVMGSRGAGKSSLVFRYAEEGLWTEAYFPTISNHFSKPILYNGVEYDTDILDTAGQDEFSIIGAQQIIGIHGFIIVYSVASRASFDNAQIIWEKLTSFTGLRSVPIVLVAAKTDLTRREVSEAQGEALAKSMGSAYVETSAKDNVNVGKVFELCLEEIEKRYGRRASRPLEPPSSRCLIM